MHMYKIGEFADTIGVSIGTLRLWDKTGELKPVRVTEGGTRYYSEAQVNSYLGTSREYLARVVKELIRDIRFISDTSNGRNHRKNAALVVEKRLRELLEFEEVDELTAIYRDTEPTTEFNVGFEADAVVDFVNKLNVEYGQNAVEYVTDPRINTIEKLFNFPNNKIGLSYSNIAMDYGFTLADMMLISESVKSRFTDYIIKGVPESTAWSMVEYDIQSSFDSDMLTESMPIIKLVLCLAKNNIGISTMSLANINVQLLKKSIEAMKPVDD